jgi:solute carrier family 39 (zinc transporter), member 1/2/3
LFVDSENVALGEIKDDDHKHGKCDMTPIILMIALSVHAIFEGIALGILPEMKETVNLMVSIVIHKCAEAMSICIAMQKSGMEFKQVLKFLCIFSSATPLGTAMGILLSGMSDIINIVFMSIAGGSFIYVSCSELIVEEFSLPGNRWLKLLAFLMGAALIGLLLLIE